MTFQTMCPKLEMFPVGPGWEEHFTSLSPAASPVREGLDGSDSFNGSSVHRDTNSGLCHD